MISLPTRALRRAEPGGDRGDEYRRPEPATEEQLLTAKKVAAFLGVHEKRVYELGIPVIRISERSLRWRREDIVKWVEERREVR